MEQVKRYDFIDYFVMNPRQNRVLGENAEGRYVLAADHARCVRDVRRMARAYLDHRRMQYFLNNSDPTEESWQKFILTVTTLAAAQRVLETWKDDK